MRERILKTLIAHAGEYVSGQTMADELGVSRAAIWKHMEVLKEIGCKLDRKQNKGYKLVSMPNSLHSEIIAANDVTNITSKYTFYHEDSVDSTNELAKKMAFEGAAHNTVVVAEEQTKGKGRRGRDWQSEKGTGIYMSMILRPDLVPTDASKTSLLAGLAVCRAVRSQSSLQAELKWPNDVVVNGKKICGILEEMSSSIDKINYIVCGIGINVNQQSFSKEIAQVASSMELLEGREFSRPQLLIAILNEFYALYEEFMATGDFAPIVMEYSKYSALIDKRIRVIGLKETEEGKCIGFDREGTLVLEKDDGTRKRILAGDVSVRGEYGYV